MQKTIPGALIIQLLVIGNSECVVGVSGWSAVWGVGGVSP